MIKYKVISPSYKRSETVKTHKVISDVTYAVHEFESHQYKSKGFDVYELPDSLKGNKARCVNYILDQFQNEYDFIILCDDDITNIAYFEDRERYKIRDQEVINLMLDLYQLSIELGTVLFGINLQDANLFYDEYNPFSFNSVVLSPFCGIILNNNSLRLDESLSLNDDYDYFLQVYKKYGKVVRLNKYHYKCDHHTLDGGCNTYRDNAKERKQAEMMIKKWGADTVSYDLQKSFNPIIRV